MLLKPLTGRRHQLRLHLFDCGFGIVGDQTYTVTSFEGLDEQKLMLHAFILYNSAIGSWLVAEPTEELTEFPGIDWELLSLDIKKGKYNEL